MDKRVVVQKLENLKNCIERIRSTSPQTADELANNYDIQDILSLNLERAIQSCIDIAAHLAADIDAVSGVSAASLFLDLANRKVLSKSLGEELSRAVGFRNLLVHRYADIDWSMVFENIQKRLPVFKQFTKEVSLYCEL